MMGQPVAKRTRAQTERKLCEDVNHMKKIRQEKRKAESSSYKVDDCVRVVNTVCVSGEDESSEKQFDDDYTVFPGILMNDTEGRDPSKPILVEDSGEEEDVFSGVGNSLGFKENVIDVTDDTNDDDTDDTNDDEEEEEEDDDDDEEEEEESLRKGSRKDKGKVTESRKRKRNSVPKHDNVRDDDGEEEEGTDDESLQKGNKKDQGKLRKSPLRKGNIMLKHVNVLDYDEEEDEERGTDDERLRKGNRKDKGILRKSPKRKRISVLKHDDVQNILLNSILNMEESHSDFSSSDSELTLPEKSDSEEESDPLSSIWTEMAFALKASEICSRDTLMVENEVASSNEVETLETPCQHGNHDLILNEEFGLCCKHCNYVKCIRDIHAPFSNSPSRRSEWREYNNVDPSFLDDLHSNDSGFQCQSDCDPFSHTQGTVWDLVPGGVRKKMFPHQCEGFEFIWNNIAGGIDIEELKNSTSIDGGNGCIISHAPGTGKTGLSLVFLQSYMKLHPRCTPVIIAPRSMLLTWEEEFHKWKIDIPFHNLNKPELSGIENIDALSLMHSEKLGGGRVKLIRLVKIYSWKKGSGILGVSYRLFDKLVSDDRIRGILLDIPGIFVFDEGHTPRNGDTDIFKALSRIKTKRRIILSGTPFQNNFQELENTLSLVRQEFGELLHTVTKRGRKRNDAKRASLISSIGRGADNRDNEKLKELKGKIAQFVHIHKGTVLQESLPGLRHTVVVLQPNEFQKSLCKIVEKTKKSFIELNYYVSLISVHPSLFPEQWLESFDVDRAKLSRLKLDPKAGIKTRFLLILLELSEVTNEKVLVFSQYIEPLTLILEQLKHSLNWREGTEVLYMDGKQDVKKRQSSISVFNNPSSEARILLASTKACCEGINLVGASRVLLLDVVWNPFVERQAISRAYRLGQKRVVHVYHLITSGTLEGDKLCRQAKKVWWSNKVFSSSDGSGNNQTTASELLEDKILEEMAQHDNLIKDIIPQCIESELIETFSEFLDKRD